jgi:asparagine synthase (glutamine-hydrolysing)
MCGIFGVSQGNSEEKIKKAIECFKYRGPDDTGVWSNDKISFANVRLAIIDPQSKSNQPLFDTNKEIGIVFNGEIYNYEEIKKELTEYDFQTNSDTEMIIYAYKKWGSECFSKFLGMFALCIYDIRKNKILLARDHAGIKPLYYYLDQNQTLAFSSEIKGILNFFGRKNFDINLGEINNLLTLGFIQSPQTLYKNIFKLEPGKILSYHLTNKMTEEESFETVTPTNPNLDQVLKNSITRHLVSDVPVGLFFSGGTDSTAIACYLNEMKINMNAYSVVMPHKSVDDKYIDLIAAKLNLNLHKYSFDVADFDQIYHEVMKKVDEPLYDASIFPTYFVSQKARQDVTVVLSGEGGDEYFLGYDRQLEMKTLNDSSDYKLDLLDQLYLYSPNFKGKKKIFAKIFLIFRKPISYFLLKMSIDENILGWKNFKELAGEKNIKPLDLDKKIYLENDLLRKIDFATSYSSLEGRVPLLDPEVIAYTNTLSNEQKLENNVLKFRLKKILEKYLPKEYIYREKSGFSSPVSYFFAQSKFLKNDLHVAIKFFELEYPEIFTLTKQKDFAKLVKTNPYYCFTLVSLYYCLNNDILEGN